MRYFVYCSLALSVAVVQITLAHQPDKQAGGGGGANGGSAPKQAGGGGGSAPKPKDFLNRGSEAAGVITTLYFLDPIANQYCFEKARYSHEMDKEGNIRNVGLTDIDFGNYRENSFTIAFAGPLLGKIVDLGTADELRERYGYIDHVGKGDGYASIHKKDGKLLILSPNSPPNPPIEFQPLQETNELFGKGVHKASATPKLGHIYLLRITDPIVRKGFELVVKLKVIEYRPGESVTIRWQRLE